MSEEVVHPHGAHALEEIVGRHRAQVVLQLQERLVDFVHEVGLDGVGEDGVTLLGDPGEVGFEVGQWADACGAVGCVLGGCHDLNSREIGFQVPGESQEWAAGQPRGELPGGKVSPTRAVGAVW